MVWAFSPEAELPFVQRLSLGEFFHVCVRLALVLEPAEVSVLGVLGDLGHLAEENSALWFETIVIFWTFFPSTIRSTSCI